MPEKRDIYCGVENCEDGYYLHAFKTRKARAHWLWETQGVTIHSPQGRGLPSDLMEKDNPLHNAYDHPIIWHQP